MKTFFKVVAFIALVALTFRAGMLVERELKELDEIGKPTYKFRSIYFDKCKAKLYLKSITWGITGNHSTSVLSLNPTREFYPDSTKEYIFEGDDFFYRQTVDSLIIYSRDLLSRPKLFNTCIKFKIDESKNYSTLNEKVLTGIQKFD